MKIAKEFLLIVVFVWFMLFAIGCGGSMEDSSTNAHQLSIGVFPIGDMLPLLVALEEGYFEDEGIDLNLVYFQSALEKDSAFQAGNIDGIITDLLVAHLLEASGTNVKITSLTLGVGPEEGPFGIVVAPGETISSVTGLAGKKIGISSNTIIEYVLDGLLEENDFSADEVEKVSVAKLPVRMEMLLSGQLDAAIFPEPMLSYAQQQGANLLIDDTMGANLSQVVLLFHEAFVVDHPSTIKAFYRAYTQAIKAIQENPQNYYELFVRETGVPQELADRYDIPEFSLPQNPTVEDLERVQLWLMAKGLLAQPIPYKDLISNEHY